MFSVLETACTPKNLNFWTFN